MQMFDGINDKTRNRIERLLLPSWVQGFDGRSVFVDQRFRIGTAFALV